MADSSYIIHPAATYEKKVIEYFYPTDEILPGFAFQWDCMKHLRVRPSELSVWAGINGHGKSMIASMVALMAASSKEKTVIASFEMPAYKTLGRMVKQATGEHNPSKNRIKECLSWMSEYIHIYDSLGRGNVTQMLSNFTIACETEGVTQYIIDSLMKCGLAEDDYSKQKFLVEDFHNAAMKMHSHVHLIAHARKTKDESDKPGKMDVAGSSGITNIADNVYTVWRNKPKETKRNDCLRKKQSIPYDLEEQPDCIVECVKSREQGGDAENQYYLWYNHMTNQYTDSEKYPFNFMTDVNKEYPL